MELKRVVVTGLGAITPLGNDVPSTWAALLEGVSGAGPITLFDASEFKTQFACQVKDFDPLKYLQRKGSAQTRSLYPICSRSDPRRYRRFGIRPRNRQ